MTFGISAGSITAATVNDSPRIAGGISSYLGLSQDYATIWRSQPNVRTAVGWYTRNVSPLSFKVYRKADDLDRRVADTDLNALLARPTPRTSSPRWLDGMVGDLLVYDNAIALKLGGDDARALWRVPPHRVTPLGGDQDPEAYRIVLKSGEERVYRWEDVLHLRHYSPLDSRWGTSPIETLRRIIAEDTAAGEYREQFWNRGARVDGVITRPVEAPDWSTDAKDRFRTEWRDAWTGYGPDAGGVPVLEEGMEYEQIGFNARESEYIDARKLTREEVASAYHVSPALLGIIEGATSSGLAEQRKAGMIDAIGPLVDFIAAELAVSLFADYDLDASEHYIEANLEARLRGDFLDQAEAISRAVGAPWMTRAEARAMFNRELLDGQGTEELIVPLNVVTGGLASPLDTAPGAPGSGQVSRPAPTKALDHVHSKDLAELRDELPRRLRPWSDRLDIIYRSHLERQRKVVEARAGSGIPLDEVLYDVERWDSELRDDLMGHALALQPASIEELEVELGDLSDLDLSVAYNYLANNARIEAEQFNTRTRVELAEIVLTPAPTKAATAEELTVAELAGDYFEDTEANRAAAQAIQRTAGLDNFNRHDGAERSGVKTKTWHVNSGRPRRSHRSLDGRTISIDDVFAVGASYGKWPGDPDIGDPHELANCVCSVTFERGSEPAPTEITPTPPAWDEDF